MALQPLEIPAAVHHLVDARLKEKDGEERRDKDLEQIRCSLVAYADLASCQR